MHFGKHKPCLLWVPDQVVDPVFRVGGGVGGGGGREEGCVQFRAR